MLSEKRERKVYFSFENDDVGICSGCIGAESSREFSSWVFDTLESHLNKRFRYR